MKAGKWRVTDQGIGFDAGGHLVNGHHRLRAILASGATIRSLVVMGLESESVQFIDVGGSRTPGHVLGMVYHIPRPQNVAALARIFCALSDGKKIVSRSDTERWADVYRKNIVSFEFAVRHCDAAPAPYVGVLAFSYAIAPLAISEFASRVRTKVGIEANSPEAATVAMLARKGIGRHSGNSQQELLELSVTAIYHKLRGTPVSLLKRSEEAMAWLRKARKGDK